MNWQIVSTLVVKDFVLFFKNRFFAFVTVFALLAYVVVYFLMPSEVDELLEIGMVAPAMPTTFIEQLEEVGFRVITAVSEEALKAAMEKGEYNVGVILADDIIANLAAGEKAEIQLLFTSDMPDEIKEFYLLFFRELSFTLGGQPLNIAATEEVLGPDMVGEQIPTRDRMLPLFAIFLLMLESIGLASLMASEIAAGTLQALLITPMRIEGLFLGKGITGIGLAFSQAALLMAVTGGLNQQPILILVALLIGSLLVTGIAFLMASIGKDMMSVMGWGMLALILLAIPTFNILLPGTVSGWVKIIPSYYLVETVHQAVNFNVGWSGAGNNLLILFAYSIAFLWLGMMATRRRFQ